MHALIMTVHDPQNAVFCCLVYQILTTTPHGLGSFQIIFPHRLYPKIYVVVSGVSIDARHFHW